MYPMASASLALLLDESGLELGQELARHLAAQRLTTAGSDPLRGHVGHPRVSLGGHGTAPSPLCRLHEGLDVHPELARRLLLGFAIRHRPEIDAGSITRPDEGKAVEQIPDVLGRKVRGAPGERGTGTGQRGTHGAEADIAVTGEKFTHRCHAESQGQQLASIERLGAGLERSDGGATPVEADPTREARRLVLRAKEATEVSADHLFKGWHLWLGARHRLPV